MNIAFFVHCFFPDHFYGTETYTLELARHYRNWGHQVTVVSAVFQGEPEEADLVTRYEYRGIPVIRIDKNRLPSARVKDTYYQPALRPVLERVLEELKPDIVHVTHLINLTAVLLEITRERGIPTYATLTDFFGFCLNNKLEAADGELCLGPSPSRINCLACHLQAIRRYSSAKPWLRFAAFPQLAPVIARLASFAGSWPGNRGKRLTQLVGDIAERPGTLTELYNRSYRAAVAPTRFLANAYRDNRLETPLHTIWFGVDIDRSPKPERPQGRLPVLGFIGQIAPHKGTDILIDAFLRLPPGSAELRIYGPEDLDRAYMAKLKASASGAPVAFLGTFAMEAMADILADIDLLVIPSRWYENSPLVLLNALATHTPVLISDVAGMTEFVEEGINGYHFRRGSVDDLEARLKALLKAPDTLARLSETTRYERTMEIMARDTFQIYS
jgi:glycosyltransferase involved in cell wall biosynthesis